jgi:hypothetical protein
MKTVAELRAIEVQRVAFALEHNGESECYTNPLAVAERDVDAFAAAIIQAERKRIHDSLIIQFAMGDGTYTMIRMSALDPEVTA